MKIMSKFDSIRFYDDSEVNEVVMQVASHPMLKALVTYTFPDKTDEEILAIYKNIHSIRDFQREIIYQTMQRVLRDTSAGLTTTGFEKLDNNTAYLFISNHRDILLDTSLLNVKLLEHDKIMTASAIGDNLVQKAFTLILAHLNRNFLVKRNLSPRELLMNSKLMSEYIYHLLSEENRSVWIAQREGRTKDGNDATHPGVLKMISMASDEKDLMDYFKKIKIVPISISYEYDPTDKLKMPQLMAQMNQEVYIKEKNEDFNNLMSGVLGQKKGIHIHIGDCLDQELDKIKATYDNSNKQIQAVAKAIDHQIIANYKLWPTNYIAYDLLNKTNAHETFYTEKEKQLFLKRLELRIDKENTALVNSFLAMYANPVVNKANLGNE